LKVKTVGPAAGSPEKSQAYTKPEATPGNWISSQAVPESDAREKASAQVKSHKGEM
jgi:hypothetical protein